MSSLFVCFFIVYEKFTTGLGDVTQHPQRWNNVKGYKTGFHIACFLELCHLGLHG